MDRYEAGYQSQVDEVNEILSLHKDNEAIYEKCKTDYREMKRDVLAIDINLEKRQLLLKTY